MSPEKGFLVNMHDQGPVRLSPQVREDLRTLTQIELDEFPEKLSGLKIANRDNPQIPPNFWNNFPTEFEVDLTLIDNRAPSEISYPEALRLFEKGSLTKANAFMSGDGKVADNCGRIEVEVFTRPSFSNQKLSPQNWGRKDTLYSIIALQHEFAHGIQGVLADIIRNSRPSLINSWDHGWLMPSVFNEGYALTQGLDSIVFLKKRKVLLDPLLDLSVGLIRANHYKPKVDFKELIYRYLNTDELRMKEIDYDNINQTTNTYALNHLMYLSIIGLRLGLEPEQIIELAQSSGSLEFFTEDLLEQDILSIREILKTIEMPFFLREEAHRIELEAQLFYCQNPDDLNIVAEQVWEQSEKKDTTIPPDLQAINTRLFKKILQGSELKDLLDYTNRLITRIWEWGKQSPYLKQVPFSINSAIGVLSAHSRREENPYLEILQRKLYLDGISDGAL